ncbi:MAG TPA: winged helix-turn-helix transcriptional regulator [Solirubrobacterales bacterium]|nr:winged helix-turn-helix transcriptional regulator [Solirubrobacterales bacterium]
MGRCKARPVPIILAAQTKRAGGTALDLLASPLNVRILQALQEGDLSPLDLRRRVGTPPESTMRVYTRALTELGVLERRRHETFPPTVEYSLTPAGSALLKMSAVLQAWLDLSPEGPMPLGGPASKSVTRALIEGWSTNIVRAVAARPYSLTELSKINVHTSYPALDRRLGAMRLVNLVEAHPGQGRGTPYRATEWLRRAISPLVAATTWERKYLPAKSARIGRLDIEAAFLLAVPLLELPSSLRGRVRLAVEVQGGTTPNLAGTTMEIESGAVTACSVRLEGQADARVFGSAMAWLRQVNGAPGLHLELGGNQDLGKTVIEALRAAGLSSAEGNGNSPS